MTLTVGQRVRILSETCRGRFGTVKTVNSRGDTATIWVEPDISNYIQARRPKRLKNSACRSQVRKVNNGRH